MSHSVSSPMAGVGDAIGNVIDRIFRGYVVDYLDFHWQSWFWPAFNLADIFIVLGVFMILATSFRAENSRDKQSEDSPSQTIDSVNK